jgi:ParB family transcriptional regulator, chromosome partitioning protein
MKSGETLRSKFGANMRESVGGDTAGFPGMPAPSGADAERLKGVSGMKRAFLITVDRIDPDPSQPRREFDPEKLRELAESLTSRGQLQPVRVRFNESAGRWVLISGERRWRAAVVAGLATLQAVETKGELDPHDILEDQLVENCVREDLKPVEQARAFKALMDARRLSHRQLAERLHIAPSAISMALALLDLPSVVQSHVEQGILPPATAYEISKVENPNEQAELAARVVTEHLSRAETVEAVRERKPGKSKGRGVSKARKETSRVIRTEVGVKLTLERAKGLDDALIRAALAEAMARLDAKSDSSHAAA